MTKKLVQESDLVLLTGTTLVNGTFDGIWKAIMDYFEKYVSGGGKG